MRCARPSCMVSPPLPASPFAFVSHHLPYRSAHRLLTPLTLTSYAPQATMVEAAKAKGVNPSDVGNDIPDKVELF